MGGASPLQWIRRMMGSQDEAGSLRLRRQEAEGNEQILSELYESLKVCPSA